MLFPCEEATLPNLKVYRAAWVIALVLIIISLFTLGSPNTPKLSRDPLSFDGAQAAKDMTTVATAFPQRVAGSDPDNRCGLWVIAQLEKAGLETHVDSFPATINGEDVALQNVYGVAEGKTPGTILILANRDVPPLATQGANDNASGVAALVELARAFTVAAHDHTLIFLATSGDAAGALGARRFVEDHQTDDLLAVIALDDLATKDTTGIGVDGWSNAPKIAPPWLWLLTPPSARAGANLETVLPGVAAQVMHLAVPASYGSQGPFVAAGVPGVTLTTRGKQPPAPNDTLDTVSNESLAKAGGAVQTMVMSIDAMAGPGAGSGGTIFLIRQRTLPGAALVMILIALLLPLLGVTVDLFAHCQRARVRLRPAAVRALLHLAPWLVLIAIVYLANLFNLFPHSPGAVIPPDARIVDHPRYLRFAILVVLLLASYAYAVAVERRLERRVATDPRATIFVSHAILVVIAFLTLLINPFSLLIVIPAAILWPLARPGGWARCILPAYLGLLLIPVFLLSYAVLLGVGWKVWWYFFLLLENRSVPVGVVLLSALFVSTAGVLAHTLHERGLAPGALTWPAVDRRGPGRQDDAAWSATGEEEPVGRRHAPRRRRRRRPPGSG